MLGRIGALFQRLDRVDYVAVFLSMAYFALLYNYVNLQVPNRVPFSPDESGILASVDLLSNNGSFVWTSFLNQKYDVNFFRPRLFTEVASNKYVTANSLGFVIFLALASHLQMLPFIVPMTAAAGMIGSYALIAEVLDKKAGLFVEAAVGLLPTYVFFSNTYMDIIPSFSFFILSLLAFFKYVRTSRTWQLEICAFLFATSIFLRPYSAIFSAGYIGAIILLRKQLRLKSLITGLMSFFLFVAPVFVLNQYAYGNPLSVGFISAENLEPVVSQNVGFDVYGTAFANHIVMLTPILFAVAVLGGGLILKGLRSQSEKLLLLILVLTSGLAFFAFGNQSHTYGFYDVTAEASLARYLMPVYLLLAYCAYRFVRRLNDMGLKRTYVLVVSVLMVSLIAGNFASNAVPSLVSAGQKYSKIVNVIQSLPEDSVIFTRTYDKLAFPIRSVAIVYTNSDLAENPDWRFIVPIVDIDKDVVPIVQKLLIDGFNVYLAPDVNDLAAHLILAGYSVSWVENGPDSGSIFRMVTFGTNSVSSTNTASVRVYLHSYKLSSPPRIGEMDIQGLWERGEQETVQPTAHHAH
jgi:hypothetical protein